MAESEPRSSRDTRLLALVIVIALAVLVLLAQFRFSDADVRSAVAPGPLERLAARAAYEDLAEAVETAVQRASPSIVLVDIEADRVEVSQDPTGRILPAAPPQRRRVAAVRLKDNFAALALPVGFHVAWAAGDRVWTLRGVDARREIAVVAVPMTDGAEKPAAAVEDFRGFAYVAVVEGAAGGPTAAPAFIGRVDTASDERWGRLLAIGGTITNPPPGALVFLLDGRLVGLVVTVPGGARALVPASALLGVIDGLPAGPQGESP